MNLPYFEFGGGLGDVFHRMYSEGYYNWLAEPKPADVALISHNPFVEELFAWHPNLSRMRVRSLGYWDMKEDGMRREFYGLPPHSDFFAPHPNPKVEVYPSPRDLQVLAAYAGGTPYVVIASSAGEPDRNIPADVLQHVLARIEEAGLDVIFVGRSYERNGRYEQLPFGCHEKLPGMNLTDQLSVPGTVRLLEGASGLVTCHSALNIAAWHLRLPQLLLYPQSVYDRHISKMDQWAFGCDFEECFHTCWDWEDHGDLHFATRSFLTRVWNDIHFERWMDEVRALGEKEHPEFWLRISSTPAQEFETVFNAGFDPAQFFAHSLNGWQVLDDAWWALPCKVRVRELFSA